MKLGVIGYGNRANFFIGRFFDAQRGVRLTAIADLDLEKAKGRMKANPVFQKYGIDADAVHGYTDLHEMMQREKLDGVLVCTNCSQHSQNTADIMPYGVPVFLEKPVSVTREQLRILREGRLANPGTPVVVSFPLRYAPICRFVKKLIQEGAIGKVQQVQALNNVPYGPGYFHGFDMGFAENGGLWPQKATHDLDYLYYLIDEDPVEVCAMETKNVFTGPHEPTLRCEDCGERLTCTEGPYQQSQFWDEEGQGGYCAFSNNPNSHDSGSVLVRYASGIHAVYSQNFYSRKEARKRGAVIIGYWGTIQFDFYTGQVKLWRHDSQPSAVYQFHTGDKPHFGGDQAMAHNFIDVMEGKPSLSTLEDGMVSALTCICAAESCRSRAFVPLEAGSWKETERGNS